MKEDKATHVLVPIADIEYLRLLKNYFGENDKTPFEHWAYSYINELMKKIQSQYKLVIK